MAFGLAELSGNCSGVTGLHQARLDAGLPSSLLPSEAHNHFSIMDEAAAPSGKLTVR